MNITSYMKDYQRKNCIKGKCITNSYFLMAFVNRMSGKMIAKAKPVIILLFTNEKKDVIYGSIVHIVVEIAYSDETVIVDPSYESEIYKHKDYVDKISELPKVICIPKLIKDFIDFIDISEKMNKVEYTSKSLSLEYALEIDYYNKQAEYVRNRLKTDKILQEEESDNILACLSPILYSNFSN